jgi:hypothetical protein
MYSDVRSPWEGSGANNDPPPQNPPVSPPTDPVDLSGKRDISDSLSIAETFQLFTAKGESYTRAQVDAIVAPDQSTPEWTRTREYQY